MDEFSGVCWDKSTLSYRAINLIEEKESLEEEETVQENS